MTCLVHSLHGKKHPPMAGFTIIELMITIVIVAILAAVAAPNMTRFILATRVNAAASDMYSALIFARSEAIKRNADIGVVPVSGWIDGWQVMAGAAVLKQQDAYPATLSIVGPVGTITYGRDGRLNGNTTALYTFSATNDAVVRTKTVTVDLGGRVLVR